MRPEPLKEDTGKRFEVHKMTATSHALNFEKHTTTIYYRSSRFEGTKSDNSGSILSKRYKLAFIADS
jgi:hypothetical protein